MFARDNLMQEWQPLHHKELNMAKKKDETSPQPGSPAYEELKEKLAVLEKQAANKNNGDLMKR